MDELQQSNSRIQAIANSSNYYQVATWHTESQKEYNSQKEYSLWLLVEVNTRSVSLSKITLSI